MSKCILGLNDLLTKAPEIAAQWNDIRNGELKPFMVSAGGHQKVWWICDKGHEWEAVVKDRYRGDGCPICSGHQVLEGFNDLSTVNPSLALEWHPTKNGDLTPKTVTAGSKNVIWWKCDNGHEWKASVSARKKHGCPACAGRVAIYGKNDLYTVNPKLAAEWNAKKNKISPYEVKENSNIKVWWICDKGHEWEAVIASRAKGSGCPFCNYEKHTSFPEQAIFYYIKSLFPSTINGGTNLLDGKQELDIFIPELKTAIEYDGEKWHRNIARDMKKNTLCREKGIRLIRVREPNLPDLTCCEIVQRTDDYSDESLNHSISQLILLLMPSYETQIDINTDRGKILELYISSEKDNSLNALHPEIVSEWNTEKNGSLTTYHIKSRSDKKVWWKCSEGHEWLASVSNRSAGTGCPICFGSKVLSGYNDLLTVNLQLANEWHPTLNGDLKPNMISANSSKKVWWKCSVGHEWQTTVGHRAAGESCPICAGKRVLKGYHDLSSVNPSLAHQWHPTKNCDLTPLEVTGMSGKKVWWLCSEGHEWKDSICHRAAGRGCPICSGRQVCSGYNDLATINPTLAAEWNYEKNEPLKPTEITAGYSKKVYWKCNKGHEWSAVVNSRNRGAGCPYCSGRKKV